MLTAEDYEEVLADHRRLVRELDVALHGEAGAAQQASLCDLIGPARDMADQLRRFRAERAYIVGWNDGYAHCASEDSD